MLEEIGDTIQWLDDVSYNYISAALMGALDLAGLGEIKLSIDLMADLSSIDKAQSDTHAAFIIMNRVENLTFSYIIFGAELQMVTKYFFSGNRKITIIYDGVDYSGYSYITMMFANALNIIDLAMSYFEDWIVRQYENAMLGYEIDPIGWDDFWDWYL